MNIISDKDNKKIASMLKKLSSNDGLTDNITLHLTDEIFYIINDKYKNKTKIKVDFLDEKFTKKCKSRSIEKNDIFKKLFPIKKSSILDCTAGFAKDSYILSLMGHNITMIECNPIISLLLNNAMKKTDIKNFHFFHGDCYDYLMHTNIIYDYIYFDFMFEKKKSNSLSSKSNETLKAISTQNNYKNKVIQLAINKCKYRVVVKEPKNSSSYLSKPSYNIKTKLLNYNIYKSNYEAFQ